MKLRSVGVGAVALSTVAASFALVPVASLAAGHHHQTFVTPKQPSTMRDSLHVLAGSRSWLLYRSTDNLASGSPTNPPAVIARSTTGKVRHIPVGDTGWSIVGNTLTGHRTIGAVDVWDLTTGAHHLVPMPKPEPKFSPVYLGAAPGGVMFNDRGELKRRSATGKITDYGKLHLAGGFALSAASGPNGIVVTDRSAATYFPFTTPKSRTVLRLHSGSDHDVECKSVSATYAACTLATHGVREILLAPLDGRPATSSNKCQFRVPRMAVAGNRVYWVAFGPPCSATNEGRLISLAAGGIAKVSNIAAGAPIVSAYGAVVAPTQTEGALRTIAAPSNAALLLTAPRSPVTVASFSLSPGLIADVDDQVDPTRPGNAVSVRWRTRRAAGNHEVLGKPRIIKGGKTPEDIRPGFLATSGPSLVYATPSAKASDHESLHVRSPFGDHTLTGVNNEVTPTLSGNRLLYLKGDIYGVPSTTSFQLYNLATGDATRLRAAGTNLQAPVLWGDFLVDKAADGSLVRTDLSTGDQVQVLPHSKSPLGMYGDYVAVHAAPTTGHRHSHQAQVINIATGASFVTPRHTYFVSLSSAGPVFLNRHYRSYLETWNGQVQRLPAGTNYGPTEVEGHSAAWMTDRARLKVVALRVPVPAPQALGAAAAASSFGTGSGTAWTAYVPYSLSLGSCHITMAHGSTTVRQLPCAPRRMTLGVASATWDGRGADGTPVGAGSYTWTVHASGGSGPALDAAGGHQPVSGTIEVS